MSLVTISSSLLLLISLLSISISITRAAQSKIDSFNSIINLSDLDSKDLNPEHWQDSKGSDSSRSEQENNFIFVETINKDKRRLQVAPKKLSFSQKLGPVEAKAFYSPFNYSSGVEAQIELIETFELLKKRKDPRKYIPQASHSLQHQAKTIKSLPRNAIPQIKKYFRDWKNEVKEEFESYDQENNKEPPHE